MEVAVCSAGQRSSSDSSSAAPDSGRERLLVRTDGIVCSTGHCLSVVLFFRTISWTSKEERRRVSWPVALDAFRLCMQSPSDALLFCCSERCRQTGKSACRRRVDHYTCRAAAGILGPAFPKTQSVWIAFTPIARTSARDPIPKPVRRKRDASVIRSWAFRPTCLAEISSPRSRATDDRHRIRRRTIQTLCILGTPQRSSI